jgi:hypothetical protein
MLFFKNDSVGHTSESPNITAIGTLRYASLPLKDLLAHVANTIAARPRIMRIGTQARQILFFPLVSL